MPVTSLAGGIRFARDISISLRNIPCRPCPHDGLKLNIKYYSTLNDSNSLVDIKFEMKTFIKIVILTTLVLCGLMSVNGSEGQIGNPPYLWSRYISEPRYIHVGNTDPARSVEKFTRRHFGFPCWALIIDKSMCSASWYAKLDLGRFSVNVLVAFGISTLATMVIRKGKRLFPFRTQKLSPTDRW
jgi:hypothetical protein